MFFELAAVAGIVALFPWPAIICLFAVFCFLLWGVSLDRSSNHWEVKWWAFFVVTAVGLLSYWSANSETTSLSGLFFGLFSKKTLVFLAEYCVLGIIYAVCLELPMAIRRVKKTLKERWTSYQEDSVYDALNGAKDLPRREGARLASSDMPKISSALAEDPTFMAFLKKHFNSTSPGVAKSVRDAAVTLFCDRMNGTYAIEPLVLRSEGTPLRPAPSLKASSLAQCLFAWATIWPAYALSWVLEDLVRWVFETLADIIKAIGDKYVSWSFKGLFDLN